MAEAEWLFVRSHDKCPPIVRRRLNDLCWYRPMLRIQESEYTNGPQLSIMTYNLFEPCEWEKYPTPKYARSTILMNKIARYNPDIVCLQELSDHSRWIERFARYGYILRVAHPNKYHSIAIGYKCELFQEFDHESTTFLPFNVGHEVEPASRHGALFICLQFRKEFLDGFKLPSKDAIIVGTTHLPLRGVRSAERTKFTASLMTATQQFADSVRIACAATPFQFYTFIAGDFNSTVDDAAYISLVSKPVQFPRWAHDKLIVSMNTFLWRMEDGRDHRTRPYSKTPETVKRVATLEHLHNRINARAISLYSVGYGSVDGENCQPITNEPWFSHWGTHSQELLDYIFVVTEWDGEASTKIESLTHFTQETQMRLMALLQMPSCENLGRPDCAQPRLGMFPSDHICMMADLELL
ncbi:RNA exonuclease NGL2 [Metschnikowia aff. pulcherrima]|uniref:RNA exonuclease NGL2 n=1 Tax=Metschnikowia aff. pulcherrima TaxID=2163413 RepID=A0A4V1AEI4_9ASCO|nr:RNA exonuclease NGL2 [Metschnikowia aff. pulcherrima]